VKQIEVQLVVVNRSCLTRDRSRVLVHRLMLPIFIFHLLPRYLLSDLGEKTVADVFERLYIEADLAYGTVDHGQRLKHKVFALVFEHGYYFLAVSEVLSLMLLFC
jgi:hypothetical protein